MAKKKQRDLFVSEEVAKEKVKVKTEIPSNYVEVKLDSLGKLNAPRVVHVRDYSAKDVLELSSAGEERQAEVLINCLNSMIWEDVDVSSFHEKDIEEIMLYVYASFWGDSLQNVGFYLDPKLEEEELGKEGNIYHTSLNIKALKTKELGIDNFKGIINISISKDLDKIGFRLPQLGDILTTKTIVEEHYFDLDRKYSDLNNTIKSLVSKNSEITENELIEESNISFDEFEAIKKYSEEKDKMFINTLQSLWLETIDGKAIETIEERLAKKSEISLRYWKLFNDFMEKSLNFGVESSVTFDYEGGSLTRDFQFQLVEFIPSVESSIDTEHTISFGN